jgi:hypothetical protein
MHSVGITALTGAERRIRGHLRIGVAQCRSGKKGDSKCSEEDSFLDQGHADSLNESECITTLPEKYTVYTIGGGTAPGENESDTMFLRTGTGHFK